MSMDSTTATITHGRIERLLDFDQIPPGLDPITGVESKDVLISPETGVKARIFLPRITGPNEKLPLFLHLHRGGFCAGSAFDSITGRYMPDLASKADVVIVAVDYGLAPGHSFPAAFDDSWAGLQWIATHSNGQGPDPWINQYVDFNRIFLSGDIAGCTLAHHVAVRAGADGSGSLQGMRLLGAIMAHSFFLHSKSDLLMQYLYRYPESCGTDNDLSKTDSNLEKMGCSKVLVQVEEKDGLRARGMAYYETLKKSGWGGKLEWMENGGEGKHLQPNKGKGKGKKIVSNQSRGRERGREPQGEGEGEVSLANPFQGEPRERI